jgi:tRNA (guanine-N7-)-methyltransferase
MTDSTMNKLIPNNSPLFIPVDKLDDQPCWDTIFGNSNPLVLEIGCGIGDFLAQMAAKHPEWNFIALDFYNKGCLKTCRRAEEAGLTNVRVIRDEARAFIRRCLKHGSLRGLIINCPDPWPKLRHRKRRLVNAQFMGFMADYLAPGADFFFATDFDDYGVDVARLMSSQPLYKNNLAPDLWRNDLEGYPRSKYMLRFIELGQEIYFVHYTRIAGRAVTGGDDAR